MLAEPHVRLIHLLARVAVEEFVRECDDDASSASFTDLDHQQREETNSNDLRLLHN